MSWEEVRERLEYEKNLKLADPRPKLYAVEVGQYEDVHLKGLFPSFILANVVAEEALREQLKHGQEMVRYIVEERKDPTGDEAVVRSWVDPVSIQVCIGAKYCGRIYY